MTSSSRMICLSKLKYSRTVIFKADLTTIIIAQYTQEVASLGALCPITILLSRLSNLTISNFQRNRQGNLTPPHFLLREQSKGTVMEWKTESPMVEIKQEGNFLDSSSTMPKHSIRWNLWTRAIIFNSHSRILKEKEESLLPLLITVSPTLWHKH
jgi:hypothetical protein